MAGMTGQAEQVGQAAEARRVQEAQELEDDAARYPDERDELLLEAAHAWWQAGQREHAMDLLEQILVMSGAHADDREFARAQLADWNLTLGREADAETHLAALRALPASPIGCHAAGEALEAHGRLEQALSWFDLAVAQLDPEQVTDLERPLGWLSLPGMILGARRRVRMAAGMAPDELDRSVPPPSQPMEERGSLVHDEVDAYGDDLVVVPPDAPGSPGIVRSDDETGPGAGGRIDSVAGLELHMLFWRVDQFAAAVGRWPELADADGDPTDERVRAAYHDRLEVRLRGARAQGAGPFWLVPADVDGLEAFARDSGGSPLDQDTRLAYTEQLIAGGSRVGWPPGRNDRCWCGSARKYKRCCGRPRSGSELSDGAR